MTRACLAAALLSLAALARAQQLPISYQPEPDFDGMVRKGVEAFAPKDAFARPSCQVVDAKPVKPWTFEQAHASLAPCLKALSGHYGVPLSVQPGIVDIADGGRAMVGLVLSAGRGAAVGTAAVRDLNHGLSLRRDRLMGFRAALRRSGEAGPVVASSVQAAVERCILPTVVRKIRSAGEFLTHYGACLKKDSELKAKDLSPLGGGDPLAVGIVSEAEETALGAMNGFVTVMGENGPVQVLFVVFAAPKPQP